LIAAWLTWTVGVAVGAELVLPAGADTSAWQAELVRVQALSGEGLGPDVRVDLVDEGERWIVEVHSPGRATASREVAAPQDGSNRLEVLLLAVALSGRDAAELDWPLRAAGVQPAPPVVATPELEPEPPRPALALAPRTWRLAPAAPIDAITAAAGLWGRPPVPEVATRPRLDLAARGGALSWETLTPSWSVQAAVGAWVRRRLLVALEAGVRASSPVVQAEVAVGDGTEVFDAVRIHSLDVALATRATVQPWLAATALVGVGWRRYAFGTTGPRAMASIPWFGARLTAALVEVGPLRVAGWVELTRDLLPVRLVVEDGTVELSPWRPLAGLELRW